MAFLLIGDRLIDRVTCVTYTRFVIQHIQLEDVDRDSNVDVAFRYDPLVGGDKRMNRLPNDSRMWLYAYRITDNGFKSIFPLKDRELPITVVYNKEPQSVRLEIVGMPPKVRENEAIEVTVRATNVSSSPISTLNDWPNLEMEECGYAMS